MLVILFANILVVFDTYSECFKVYCDASSVVNATYAQNMLNAHNTYREMHNTPPLVWDAKLAARANIWATHLCDTNTFTHSNYSHGENIGAEKILDKQVKQWYDEIKDYDYSKPGDKTNGIIGHFTQVVWKNTHKLGCAIVHSNTNGNCNLQFDTRLRRDASPHVCMYDPPGNGGNYADNVLPVAE